VEEKQGWNKVNHWEDELALLDSIIATTELLETTKWGGKVYTFNGKNVLGIGGFKSYFGVWFFNGVNLKDDAKVLVNAQEGVTKALRQWRFQSKQTINEKLLLDYIRESIENEKLGKTYRPEKKEVVICSFFKEQLNANKDLECAFNAFSPYKQKEFLEYINTAKQEKTKIARMEKIKPMLLQNVGLNDKYN
jgi:uncharacterized protein YdeI (YjbR/CyaY-like superfamily)